MSVRRVVQVPAYWLAVGVAVMVVSPLLSIFASVQIAENRAEQTRAEQQRADALVKAAGTRLACEQFGRLLDAYDPVTSAVGRDVRQVYVFLYNLIQCHPPRK